MRLKTVGLKKTPAFNNEAFAAFQTEKHIKKIQTENTCALSWFYKYFTVVNVALTVCLYGNNEWTDV